MDATPDSSPDVVKKAIIVRKSPEVIERLRKNLRAIEAEFDSGQFMSEKALDGVINEAVRLGRTQDLEWVRNHAKSQMANTHRQIMAKKTTKLSEDTKKKFEDRVQTLVQEYSNGTILFPESEIASVLKVAINSRKIGGSSWDERWLQSFVQRRTVKKMNQKGDGKETKKQQFQAPKISDDFPKQNPKEAIGSNIIIKFSGMPETTNKNGITRFVLLSAGIEFDVLLEKKVWAAAVAKMLEYDDWFATATGSFGDPTSRGFILKEPVIKVVEL